ncbi:MAG: ABC transporter permease, partial [Dehalococcoidia bacterium]
MALLFFAINILGDPVSLLLDEDAPQEAIDAMRDELGLNRPLYVRFGDFFWDLSRLDFGTSLRHRIDARGIIVDRLPNTAVLAVVAWILGSIGIPLGMLAARRPRGIMDRIVNILSFAIISIPEFWLALMLILLVAVQWNLLPTSGYGGLGPGGWKFMVLPALTLAPRVLGRFAQITRAAMIDEISKGYVATARSKGLAETTILYSHVLKNASISIVTLMGDELA